MVKTLLISGPAASGKSTLLKAVARDYPDHCWHLVRLTLGQPTFCRGPLRTDSAPWASIRHTSYSKDEALMALPELVNRITSSPDARGQAIIAFEAEPDPILRHAYTYDLRIFVMPPTADERAIFRTHDEARDALTQVMRDSAAFAAEVFGLDAGDSEDLDMHNTAMFLSAGPDGRVELTETHLARFLTCPFGAEVAVQVQFQPAFGPVADADIVILNTGSGRLTTEADLCWRKMLRLLARLRRPDGSKRLAYACDLADPHDPHLQRIRHKMAECLCKV